VSLLAYDAVENPDKLIAVLIGTVRCSPRKKDVDEAESQLANLRVKLPDGETSCRNGYIAYLQADPAYFCKAVKDPRDSKAPPEYVPRKIEEILARIFIGMCDVVYGINLITIELREPDLKLVHQDLEMMYHYRPEQLKGADEGTLGVVTPARLTELFEANANLPVIMRYKEEVRRIDAFRALGFGTSKIVPLYYQDTKKVVRAPHEIDPNQIGPARVGDPFRPDPRRWMELRIELEPTENGRLTRVQDVRVDWISEHGL
jgi:hypothetical protein